MQTTSRPASLLTPVSRLGGKRLETELAKKKKRRKPQTRLAERNGKKSLDKERARTWLECSALPLVILADPKVQILLEFSVHLNF
ncbi:hypothetical protein CHMI_03746 [Cellulomonas hominis]|nr:hypothetical protein CHMI_03746 [Cellulomonas hominis]